MEKLLHYGIAFLLIALLLFISGCTSSQYVPCCIKEGIFNSSTGLLSPDPQCRQQDGTQFGSCDPALTAAFSRNSTAVCVPSDLCPGKGEFECKKLRPTCEWGGGACAPSSCTDLDNEETCLMTQNCDWDGTAGACTGGAALWVLPICVDDIPKSCINNKCSAMMCGFSASSSAPPPSSQDWDAAAANSQSVMSQQELSNPPAINLQGTSCSFETMDRKLFNQVTRSRGSLWVNSLRFGVGASFSDYEQAKYFFPPTDYDCSINPLGTKERFTLYMDEPANWCPPTNSYFHCAAYNLDFTDQNICRAYCDGLAPPSDCNPANGLRYQCTYDKFAYADRDDCKAVCGAIPDPSACTDSDAVAPFLEPDGRYREKYVSDYLFGAPYILDTSDNDHLEEAVCLKKGARDGSVWLPYYSQDNWACDDFNNGGGGWGATPTDGPWFTHYSFTPALTNGPMKTYYETHKWAGTDFDYEYYGARLQERYLGQGYTMDQVFPFECKNSLECKSGSCDTTQYTRSLCRKTDGSTVDCGCSVELRTSQGGMTLVCSELGSTVIAQTQLRTQFPDYQVGIAASSEMFTKGQEYENSGGVARFRYYVESSVPAAQRPKLFRQCGVAETQSNVQMCVGNSYRIPPIINIELPGGYYWFFESAGGSCPDGTSSRAYDRYEIEFDGNSPSNSLGVCNVTNAQDPPRLDVLKLGWCAGCTYATLAVQKVDWGAVDYGELGYACYEWRGTANYTVGLPLNGPDDKLRLKPDGTADASVLEVNRNKDNGNQHDLNGPVERGPWDNGWGDDYAYYKCEDGWGHGGSFGWWPEGEIPYPSAPYLRDKLTSYLQSNVMPILDVQTEVTSPVSSSFPRWAVCSEGEKAQYYCKLFGTFTSGPYYDSSCSRESYGGGNIWGDTCDALESCEQPYRCEASGQLFDEPTCGGAASCGGACELASAEGWVCNNNGKVYSTQSACEGGWSSCPTLFDFMPIRDNYYPTQVCTNYMGDGAALYVVGSTDALQNPNPQGQTGRVAGVNDNFINYLTMDNDASATATPNVYNVNGEAAVAVRAAALKSQCPHEPLVGLEIAGYKDADETSNPAMMASLIGDSNSPGTLHKFFYKPLYNELFPGGLGTYEQMVARGTPNTYTGKVDVLMQQWEPACSGAGPLQERVEREFGTRMNFSRALLGNFSKPSLIWKFHFEETGSCYELRGGEKDYSYFFGYLFNNTAAMVDAGITGIIYDSWMTEGGEGWGPQIRPTTSCWEGQGASGNCNGPTWSPDPGYETQNTPTFLSQDAAESPLDAGPGTGKLGTPFCDLQRYSKQMLGITKMTYGQKLIAQSAPCMCEECTPADFLQGRCNATATSLGAPQHYCNDGNVCNTGGRADVENLKCPSTCVNSGVCQLCNSTAFDTSQSFCRIVQSGMPPGAVARDYSDLSNENWEWLAGLDAQDKCCLVASAPNSPSVEYTYVAKEGQKQRTEFLQYPTRGELGIDCGRTPDTSVLAYCNIIIDISQKQFACFKVG